MHFNRFVATFVHVFINSLLPIKRYYKKLLHTKLGFSLKYYFVLIFIVNSIALILIGFRYKEVIPSILSIKKNIITSVASFPEDLRITITNGELMTTYDRPYFMWYSENGIPHPIIVIDENASLDQIHQYESNVLLTSQAVVVQVGDIIYQYRFTNRDNFTFSKLTALDLEASIERFFQMLPFIVVALILVLFIVVPIMVFLLQTSFLWLLSAAVFLGTKLIHRRISFEKVFHVSLHSSTVPLMLEYFFFVTGATLVLPFGFTLIYLLFITLSLYEIYAD